VTNSTKPFLGRDAIFGILFVFASSFGVTRYLAHDTIGATVGLVASLPFAALFFREVTAGQSRRTVIWETALAVIVAAMAIAVGWLYVALRE
jgi:hypothetical protein